MEYTFTLRRETGIALLAGLAVCFVLVFLAGWVVGLNGQVSRLAADTTARRSEAPSERGTHEPVPPSPQADSTQNERATMLERERDDPADAWGTRRDTAAPVSTRTDTGRAATAAFTIQIGGYADRANAQQVARRVRRAGETVFVRPEQQKGRTLYRVWVGRYETRSAAARRLDAVGDYTGSAFVTRMGEAP